MCTLCLVALGAIVAAMAPGSAGTFEQQKINEFQALVETYLPPGARSEQVRTALNERMRQLAAVPTSETPREWRAWLPTFRPNERRLKARARASAEVTFDRVRESILNRDPELRELASSRAIASLADFYTGLATYPGDRANRVMKRAFTLLGPTVVPAILIGAGAYLAASPEICGALPGPLGAHAHHVLLGVGASGFVGLMGLSVTERGKDWLLENGTPGHDRALGARRAEVEFWTRLSELWSADPELPSLAHGDANVIAHGIFRQINWTGSGVLGACEDFLSQAPACHSCALDEAG